MYRIEFRYGRYARAYIGVANPNKNKINEILIKTNLITLTQHYLTMMGATVAIPFLLCPALCIEDTDPARGYIISTIFFTSGIVTLLQTTFGCRYAKETRKLSLFHSSLFVRVKSRAHTGPLILSKVNTVINLINLINLIINKDVKTSYQK